MKKLSIERWLISCRACPQARASFRRTRRFDSAWKALDTGIWVWWLGKEILGLGYSWDEKFYNYGKGECFLDHPSIIKRMKGHIRVRAERHYLAFLKTERRKR